MEGIIIAASALGALIISALFGKWLIPVLKRMNAKQTISQYVESLHKEKQHTPMMGGIMFIVATLFMTVIGICALIAADITVNMDKIKELAAGIVMMLLFTMIGFLDDYIKAVKKRNVGLTEIQKTALQILIAAAYLFVRYLMGDHTTSLLIPFTNFYLELGIFYYPIVAVAIYGFVNAVNLTDGVDGLCGSVTLVASCFFVVAASVFAETEHSLFAAVLAGSILGFLIWNFHPAKVFMGDTGSMFLGSAFVVMAFSLNIPLIMLPVGIIYLIEAMSVVIQVTYYKITKGKRIWKMTPIHHHYELSGWSEYKIVITFSLLTAIMCGVTAYWLITAYSVI